MMNKESMTRMLRESNTGCEVKFRKVDGTERLMVCTLNPDLMPPPKDEEKTEKPKKKSGLSESEDHMVVWDLEKGAWRSFRCDSILLFSRERSTVQK
jgi:hypothetical protein